MTALNKLGLTKYEEAVYLALLQEGRAQSKKISLVSKVPPTAVYPTLKTLIAKGLVFKIQGDIGFFQATPPKLALESLAEKKSDELKIASSDAIALVAAIKQNPFTETREAVSLSKGVDASHAITEQFIKSAKKSVYVFGWRFRSSKHMYSLLNEMKAALNRADIRIILTTEELKERQLLKDYQKMGIQMRYYPSANFSIIVCDAKKCKITVKSPDIGDRINILVEDADLSAAMQTYFLDIWRKSKPCSPTVL